MNTCKICNGTISENSQNQTNCAKCTGKMGGRPKSPQKVKTARVMKNSNGIPTGYLYFTRSMLDEDERLLFPNGERIILVHRLAMAKHLNRPIEKGEIIMHIDGDKWNNKIENLMLGNQATNIRQHYEAKMSEIKWRNLSVLLLGLLTTR